MRRPKIMLKCLKVFNKNTSHKYNVFRYYGNKVVDLNEVPIMTEKQLCWAMFNHFGKIAGRYMVIAYPTKNFSRKIWNFWIGEINEDGFQSDRRGIATNEDVKMFREEAEQSDDPSERSLYEELATAQIKELKEKKYGFIPFLKPSGRRGEFIFWEDE